MWSRLNRKIIILTFLPAAVILYFSLIGLAAYGLAVLAGVLLFRQNREKLANYLANTATVLMTLVILAVLLEVGLHLKPHLFIGNHDPDVVGDFSDFTSPGYLTEKVFDKPAGAFRIMSIGDSFAVYPPDNDPKLNYNSLLAAKFASAGQGEVDLVNFGMPAVGPGYYWHTLKKFGGRVRPDLVLVSFFLGNDFEEWEPMIILGNFITEPMRLPEKVLGYLRFRNWRLYTLIERKYRWFKENRRIAEEANQTGERDHGSFSHETFLRIERDRSRIFRREGRSFLEQNWRHCAPILGQMKQWCDDHQAELVLMISPDQFQVDKDLRAEVLQKYQIPPESLDLAYPDALLTDFCREHRIHCVDLLPAFQQEAGTKQLYALRDTHWNAAGNRLAAEVVYKYLTENKLIKLQ